MRNLVVRGARQHNLKNIDVEIPRDRLTVITGRSGSGKSSLAFDTIYAEGQRRYVESLSLRSRQAHELLPKPDVDLIEGLSPALAIRQRSPSKNPRSTVATATEIHDFLRLLYARAGRPHCPECGRELSVYTDVEIVDAILALPEGSRFAVQAPVHAHSDGGWDVTIDSLRRDGFVRVWIDGEVHDLGGPIETPDQQARVEVQIDRLRIREGVRSRLAEAVELGLKTGSGVVTVHESDGTSAVYHSHLCCPEHGRIDFHTEPQSFSFNRPSGACPVCEGLGEKTRFEVGRVVPDPSLSVRQGAIAPWGPPGSALQREMLKHAKRLKGFDINQPWESLSETEQTAFLYGQEVEAGVRKGKRAFSGVIPDLERRLASFQSADASGDAELDETFEFLEEGLAQFQSLATCRACDGTRLCDAARAFSFSGLGIADVCALSIREARAFFNTPAYEPSHSAVVEPIITEVRSRLRFLDDVGLGYLSLARGMATLSSGEAQRVRLATQIGTSLVGVLYVLDEPSVGLHARDTERLTRTLLGLRDAGNTVLVVEHEVELVRAADHVVELGPGAGELGGSVVAQGTPQDIARLQASEAARELRGEHRQLRESRRDGREGSLDLRGANVHNLKSLDVSFPLGVMTCVTGVSGSGKSSLVMDSLLPAVRDRLAGRMPQDVGLEGVTGIDKVIAITQAPIGRTPRSNPATFSGLMDGIRELFASLPEARARGYRANRFSFNVKGGRCEACRGEGAVRVRMQLLPDVYVKCSVCQGARYNRETLAVRYKGLSIADVLGLTIAEALPVFEPIPKLRARLSALASVGMGYVRLGQSATTLSGGEAQRLKLARELSRQATGRTLYVLDEPTTGLAAADVSLLLDALNRLVDGGNTVIVVEHDMAMIHAADHIIDVGPEAGDSGGLLVAEGTPEAVAVCSESHTGRHLRHWLSQASV